MKALRNLCDMVFMILTHIKIAKSSFYNRLQKIILTDDLGMKLYFFNVQTFVSFLNFGLEMFWYQLMTKAYSHNF